MAAPELLRSACIRLVQGSLGEKSVADALAALLLQQAIKGDADAQRRLLDMIAEQPQESDTTLDRVYTPDELTAELESMAGDPLLEAGA